MHRGYAVRPFEMVWRSCVPCDMRCQLRRSNASVTGSCDLPHLSRPICLDSAALSMLLLNKSSPVNRLSSLASTLKLEPRCRRPRSRLRLGIHQRWEAATAQESLIAQFKPKPAKAMDGECTAKHDRRPDDTRSSNTLQTHSGDFRFQTVDLPVGLSMSWVPRMQADDRIASPNGPIEALLPLEFTRTPEEHREIIRERFDLNEVYIGD